MRRGQFNQKGFTNNLLNLMKVQEQNKECCTEFIINGNNGVSENGNTLQLGQPIGAAGDPGSLIHDTELPFGGNVLYFGRSAGNSIGFAENYGIAIVNNTGQAYQAIWEIGGNVSTFAVSSPDGNATDIQFMGSSLVGDIFYNNDSVNPGRFDVNVPWIMDGGVGYSNTVVLSSITPTYSIFQTDVFLLVDTTSGDTTINVDATTNFLHRQEFSIKKTSSDVNHVIITMIGGTTIQGLGAATTTYTIGSQGNVVTFYVDDFGNAYVKSTL